MIHCAILLALPLLLLAFRWRGLFWSSLWAESKDFTTIPEIILNLNLHTLTHLSLSCCNNNPTHTHSLRSRFVLLSYPHSKTNSNKNICLPGNIIWINYSLTFHLCYNCYTLSSSISSWVFLLCFSALFLSLPHSLFTTFACCCCFLLSKSLHYILPAQRYLTIPNNHFDNFWSQFNFQFVPISEICCFFSLSFQCHIESSVCFFFSEQQALASI